MYLSNCCNSVPFNDILHEFEGIQQGNCLECGEHAEFKKFTYVDFYNLINEHKTYEIKEKE